MMAQVPDSNIPRTRNPGARRPINIPAQEDRASSAILSLCIYKLLMSQEEASRPCFAKAYLSCCLAATEKHCFPSPLGSVKLTESPTLMGSMLQQQTVRDIPTRKTSGDLCQVENQFSRRALSRQESASIRDQPLAYCQTMGNVTLQAVMPGDTIPQVYFLFSQKSQEPPYLLYILMLKSENSRK